MSETTVLTVRATADDLAKVEMIVAEVAASGVTADSGHFGRAFRMAAAIRALHQAITVEMMKEIMHLQGTGLGFLTDKDKDGGYPEKVVKLVAVEAALMGAYWVGNEFNIISERPYLTKNFFTRKLREMPGFTDLVLYPGVPVMMGDKGALVPYVATWKMNGQPMRIERMLTKLDDKRDLDERICVKVNSGMGADAILGKAERKIKAAIYLRLTGSDLTDGEVDTAEGLAKPMRGMDDLAAKIQRGNGNGATPPADTTRPQTTDEPSSDLRDFATMELATVESYSDVDALKATLLKRAETEADRTMVTGLCEARTAAIRESRGERSNKTK